MTKFKIAISSVNLLDLLILQVNYTKLLEMLFVIWNVKYVSKNSKITYGLL
jgi:hypothetical protein